MSTAADHLDAIQTIVYHSLYGQTFSNTMLAYLGKASGGAFGTALSSVTWSRNSPWAMNQDFDGDGIPDALDGYYGQGAVPPTW